MNCKKCGSENIQVVAGNSSASGKGCLWSIGRFILIICTAGLWLIIGGRKGKITTKTRAVCLNCGNKWNI